MKPNHKTQRIFVLCYPTHQTDSMCIRQLLVFPYLRTKLGVIHHRRYKNLFVRRFDSILRFFQPCKWIAHKMENPKGAHHLFLYIAVARMIGSCGPQWKHTHLIAVAEVHHPTVRILTLYFLYRKLIGSFHRKDWRVNLLRHSSMFQWSPLQQRLPGHWLLSL